MFTTSIAIMPSVTSTTGRNLTNVREQLRSGKTRGKNGSDLAADQITKLRLREAKLMTELAVAKEARNTERIERVNRHTAEVVAVDGNLTRSVIGEASNEILAAVRQEGGESRFAIETAHHALRDQADSFNIK